MSDVIGNALWSALAAILIGLWQEFGETKIPKLQWIPKDQAEPELKRSKRAVRQRAWFLLSAACLGFFVGALIHLYIRGFMADRHLNSEAILFCQLTGGFLMPNILMFLNKLNIEKHIDRMTGL
ncbi:hypothetical protein [Paludibacterium purpuratum]|uniref:Uncharacterized protein n=1 Tax=Paludibacterium purpuratum TaxID=1144873 RepID=A0A4R7BDT1_9NEIS|nr:hypothetical protein [Paludibacterium purpuratum]TDR81916.1 hypothetical protein DFP86_10226 [Paludibacterium purpuratum]